MQWGEDAGLAGAALVPFRENTTWTLSEADGRKVLYARVVDPAGNPSDIASCSVTLDTTPPSSALSPLLNVTAKERLEVSWRGVDATSGIAGYDVQFQEDGDPWTDLMVGTASTCATFEAKDGHIYAFRVRALDRAGNQEPYPGTATVSVRVDVPVPERALSGQVLGLVIVTAIVAVCVVGAVVVIARRRGAGR